MEIDYTAIGAQVRKYRHLSGLTQEVLAEQCGISVSFLGHIERGTRKMSLETLCRLCQVFHISVDRLLFSQLSSSRMQNLSQQIAALSFSSREQEKSFYDAVSALILGMDAFLP